MMFAAIVIVQMAHIGLPELQNAGGSVEGCCAVCHDRVSVGVRDRADPDARECFPHYFNVSA